MSKVKMLALTAIAAVAVGTGALVSAPAASALPNQRICDGLVAEYNYAALQFANAIAMGDSIRAAHFAVTMDDRGYLMRSYNCFD